MPDSEIPVVSPDAAAKAAELQHAFALFNQVSAELTQAYEALQARVASLTEELAVANGELRRQYQEKEALSERLSSLLDALPAGVVLLDQAANVVALNPAAIAMLGPQALGRHWGDVVRDCLEPTLTVGEWMLGERLPASQRLAFRDADVVASPASCPFDVPGPELPGSVEHGGIDVLGVAPIAIDLQRRCRDRLAGPGIGRIAGAGSGPEPMPVQDQEQRAGWAGDRA